MMKDSLLFESNFETFEEMQKYTNELQDLYDTHDGEELLEDRSTWDNDYMDRQMARVVRNFSKERLDHLKDVIRHLRGTPAVIDTASYSNQPRRAVRSNKYRGKANVKAILAGGAAGILAIGIATPFIESLAARIAIGAVVVCGTAYICHRKERYHEQD